MSTNDNEEVFARVSSRDFALAKIADALGCDVSSFYESGLPHELAQFSEMVYLWGRTRDLDCRERALDVMRNCASKEAQAQAR